MVTEEQNSYAEAIYEMPYMKLHTIERDRVDCIIKTRTAERTRGEQCQPILTN
jgi:hypothetical protein